MTTYTAINNSEIDTDSPITESLMTRFRDNPIAITEKAAGAPVLANGYVTNGMLDTSLANYSHASTTRGDFTMTGGEYIFMPQWKSNGSVNGYAYGGIGANNESVLIASSVSTYTTRMSSASVITGVIYCQWRYVNASPPHDMGDGDIPMFVYAVIDNATGDIESISSAVDPVWLANGPTKAMPDGTDKNGEYIYQKTITPEIEALGLVERKLAIAGLKPKKTRLTEAIKHADRDIVPHPFVGNDLTDKTVVMLDPVSAVVRELSEISAAGEDIHDIIRDKYINIGNTALQRVTPAGLLIPSTAWKKTK